MQVYQVFNQALVWRTGYISDQNFSLKKHSNSLLITSLFAKEGIENVTVAFAMHLISGKLWIKSKFWSLNFGAALDE